MRNNIRKILAALAVAAGVAGSLTAGVAAEIFEQVLVKVNGDIVTKSDFEMRQVAELRNRPELNNAPATSPELQKAVAEITPDLILSAVDELLLVQRGRELGWAMSDEQFNTILGNIKKQNNLEDDATFQGALKQEGLTLADLRKNLEKSMLVSQVQRAEVNDKISITEEESKAYYAAHTGEFTSQSEITLREILIEVPASDKGVNVAQDDEAKARADAIRVRLLAGEPFPRLAADFSAAPSRANGGLIGPLKHDELAPAFQKVLDAMQLGEVTQPVRTARGYQLLKLESRTDSRIRSFTDARDDIGNRVADGKRQGALQKYLEGLRAQATITWRNDELKRAYEVALAKRTAAVAAAPQAQATATPAPAASK
jgi:peptidyl-prolyl cis-trans isomerase SurA